MNADVRQNILDHATHLFSIQGFYGTGLNQILKESGAPKGSLYYYFPDGKEQLAKEAVLQLQKRITNGLDKYFNKNAPLAKEFEVYLNYLAVIFEEQEKLNPLSTFLKDIVLINDEMRTFCMQCYEEVEKQYANKIRLHIKDEEKSDQFAKQLVCLIEGATSKSLIIDSGQPFKDVIPFVYSIFPE